MAMVLARVIGEQEIARPDELDRRLLANLRALLRRQVAGQLELGVEDADAIRGVIVLGAGASSGVAWPGVVLGRLEREHFYRHIPASVDAADERHRAATEVVFCETGHLASSAYWKGQPNFAQALVLAHRHKVALRHGQTRLRDDDQRVRTGKLGPFEMRSSIVAPFASRRSTPAAAEQNLNGAVGRPSAGVATQPRLGSPRGLVPGVGRRPSIGTIGAGAGRLAQLVERLPYKQEVTGSSPVPPT